MKIELPNITLLAIDCTPRIQGTINALSKCMNQCVFGAVKLLSHTKPLNLPDGIEYVSCPYIGNINVYNYYMFKEMAVYVDTSHMLLVQDHAYIIDAGVWKNSWLEYDYIGAPWNIVPDAFIVRETGEHVQVGNGGFSLRSKKLLEIPKKYDMPLLQDRGYYNEDGNICVYHRVKMLELGVKYAPFKEALSFSIETPMPENKNIPVFGFHRFHPTEGWR